MIINNNFYNYKEMNQVQKQFYNYKLKERLKEKYPKINNLIKGLKGEDRKNAIESIIANNRDEMFEPYEITDVENELNMVKILAVMCYDCLEDDIIETNKYEVLRSIKINMEEPNIGKIKEIALKRRADASTISSISPIGS